MKTDYFTPTYKDRTKLVTLFGVDFYHIDKDSVYYNGVYETYLPILPNVKSYPYYTSEIRIREGNITACKNTAIGTSFKFNCVSFTVAMKHIGLTPLYIRTESEEIAEIICS